MSLYNTLQISTSAINAYSKLTEVAGNNIANIGNPEYAKQRAQVESLGTVGAGDDMRRLGVKMADIESARDELLDKQVISETSKKSTLDKQAQFMDGVEWALGERVNRTGNSSNIDSSGDNLSPNGLGKTIDDFFNAFHEVSAAPTNETQKRILVEKANILANQFNSTDARLREIDTSVTNEINSDITKVNNILNNIATLNKDIGVFENASNGAKALGLRDSRQAALEDLAQYIDFTTSVPADANTSAMQIIVKDSPGGSDLILVDGAKVSNTLSFDGTNVQAGSTPVNVKLTGGALHGLASVKSGIISSTLTDLDNLAKQFITSVNGVYPTDFFDSNMSNFTAQNMKLDNALTADTLVVGDTGDAGANNVALAVVGLRTERFSTAASDNINGTFSSHYNGLIGNVGQELSGAKQQLKNQTMVKDMIAQRRESVSGVSIDEEVTDLMKFQQAFQASARIVSVIDEMMNTLVNGMLR